MVFYNGLWGTVCDDWFGMREAHVACRGLGYKQALSYSNSYTESPNYQGDIF